MYVVTTAAAACFGAVLASPASASCLATPTASASVIGSPAIVPAAYYPAPPGDDHGPASIVGLWQASFIARGNSPDGLPDNTLIDDAYVQWHSGGTEIMNSSRPPIIGSVCLGVWTQTGRNTYKLTHVTKSWDADGFTFIGPAVILEEVTISRSGQSYTGTFSLTQYDVNGNVVPALPGLPAEPVVGVIKASRITAE
jgi:hypothetical protein